MHKLVILIKPLGNWVAFEDNWPAFLDLAEQMPGLRREASVRVERSLFGNFPYVQAHEMFFDTREAVEQAMASDIGRMAGKLLQEMTGGQVVLFIAEYKEDDIESIRQYKQKDDGSE